MEDLTGLENILGVHFKDRKLLQSALTHRSYLNEHPEFSQEYREHNERLEFLGDAVLELLVSEHLYNNFQKPEGEMTNLRAALVNSEALSKIAKSLKIEDYLLLSKGEKKDVGRARTLILANALEAVIGAFYIDQGIEKTRIFIKRNILSCLPNILQAETIKDPKSRFQEIAQEKFGITPNYKVLKEWGPDHQRKFSIGVYLNEKLIAQGQGFSKQEAEEETAQKALKQLDTSNPRLCN